MNEITDLQMQNAHLQNSLDTLDQVVQGLNIQIQRQENDITLLKQQLLDVADNQIVRETPSNGENR